MLVTCPNCETTYNVNPKAMKRKKLKCSVCSHIWKTNSTTSSSKKKKGRSYRYFFSIILIVAICGFGAFITVDRNRISANFPETIVLYQFIGLPLWTSPDAVTVSDLIASRNNNIINISGTVSNHSAFTIHTPPLKITVIDNDDSVLAETTISVETAQLRKAESVTFSGRLELAQPLDNDAITETIITPLLAPIP